MSDVNEKAPQALDGAAGEVGTSHEREGTMNINTQQAGNQSFTMEQLQYLSVQGPRLGLYTGTYLSKMELPPLNPLVGKWFTAQSIVMVYAKRGVGKTMFALGLAQALATGTPFLGYDVPHPRRVLYVDGEMAPTLLQKRIRLFGLDDPQVSERFMVVSHPLAGMSWLLLHEEDGRRQLDEIIRTFKPDVVILDNKSTLFSAANENDARTWQEIQDWLIRTRTQGMAVVIVHHSGKGGDQRGSSMHEVVLDASILLEPSHGQHDEVSCAFNMRFTKARDFHGKDSAPKTVRLGTVEGKAKWEHGLVQVVADKKAKAQELAAEGRTQREIATELGVSLGTVNSYLKK